MNVTEFTYLLQYPEKITEQEQTDQLQDILEEYPYFQAARALQLKGLKTQNSYKYNNALKMTAAYTADREILFDFITSEEFLQNTIADSISGKGVPLGEKEILSEEVDPNPEISTEMIEESTDQPLPRSARDADKILDPSLFKSKDPDVDKALAEERKKAAAELQIGKPLEFTKKERHSFGEWLQLTTFKPIRPQPDTGKEQSTDKEGAESLTRDENEKARRFELIDRFIENEPRLGSPTTDESAKVDLSSSLKLNKKELMTETLAKVYLEQKKYKKAIQAYKILSLKYPEKSGFFADRIKAVKALQRDKT